jgi:hypothetical protein
LYKKRRKRGQKMTKGGVISNADLTAGDILTLTNCIEQAQFGFSAGLNALDKMVELLKRRGINRNIKTMCPRGCKEEKEAEE